MKVGDIVLTKNDNGRFYKGAELVIERILNPDIFDKNIYVRSIQGQTASWYDPKDLILKGETQ